MQEKELPLPADVPQSLQLLIKQCLADVDTRPPNLMVVKLMLDTLSSKLCVGLLSSDLFTEQLE